MILYKSSIQHQMKNKMPTILNTIVAFYLILFVHNTHGIGFTSPNGPIKILVNDTITIACTINVPPPNGTYLSFWRKSSGLVDSRFIEILNETSILLSIPNAQAVSDIFTCKLINGGDTVRAVSYNYVYVGYKPSKIIDFKCRSYNWEDMNCTFTSPYNPVVPEYTLRFALDQKERHDYVCKLEGEGRSYWCFLDFRTNPPYRQSHEFYYFKLYATNNLGNFTEYFTINNYESVILAKPTNISSSNISSHRAVIIWNFPDIFGSFPYSLFHKISYMSEFYKNWTSVEIETTKQKSCNISLDYLEYPFAWYDVQVRSKVLRAPNNDEMWSDFVSTVFRTHATIPYEPPKTDIGSFHVNDNGHIFIYWKDLPKYKKNGPDSNYKILVENEFKKPAFLSFTMAKYERNSLNISKDLEFTIYSNNSLGNSKNTSKIRVPNIRNRCLPPRNIKKILHNKTYNLSWSPPILSAEIESYTVFWCVTKNELPNQCESSIDFQRVNKFTNNFTYLADDTLNFAVSANTKISSSGMVWALCTALPNNDIGKLSTIWINKMQPTFIEFKWNLGCVDQTILEGYNLSYCPIKDPKTLECKNPEKHINITSGSNSYNLTNLSPYTTYKTVISMYSEKNIGPPSDPLVNTTLETAPSPPRNLSYQHITNTSVTLYWTAPEYINGVLNKYEVVYNGKHKTVEKRNTSNMEFVLNQLDSFIEYEIYVVACTVACSNSSDSIKIKTAIGVPGELSQFKLNYDDIIKIVWQPPKVRAGLLQYYELTAKMIGENGEQNKTVQIKGTECTLLAKCVQGLKRYEFYVRAVNVINSLNTTKIVKRDANSILASKYMELENGQYDDDNKINSLEKKHSNAEINSRSIQNQYTNSKVVDFGNHVNGKAISKTVPKENVDFDSNICREQDDSILKEYLESDKYAVHLRGNESSTFYICQNGTTFSAFYVHLTLGVFGFLGIMYLSFKLTKKFKSMKDIGVELPAGLVDNKDDKGKHLNLDCNIAKPDITRSSELICSSEQEVSLLGTRIEAGSSHSSKNTSNCKYNEAIDELEPEQQNDDDNAPTISENSDIDKSSPTPLLSSFYNKSPPNSPVRIQAKPVNAAPIFPLSSSNYVPASMLIRPSTTNGYVTHDSVMGKPVTSGYVPWSAIASKTTDSLPDDLKVKTPIVASTDIQGISGYVTHKQLSDYGQLMH